MNAIPAYHQASKHAPGRFAPGPGYMDWENQPEPFRWFTGAPVHPLPVDPPGDDPPFAALLQPGAVPPQPLTRDNLSRLLLFSFGLAAWKEYMGERWPLRCHPSSGNLHPIEAFLIAPSPLFPGVHHYLPRDHCLETRRPPPPGADWDGAFPPGSFLLVLSLIHRRETWKYGLRAYRYGQLNLGHAAAALAYSAAALGWEVTLRTDGGDDDLATLLGLEQTPDQDGEHPGLWLAVDTRPGPGRSVNLPALPPLAARVPLLGLPNSLGDAPPTPWPGVEEAVRTFHKGREGWSVPAMAPSTLPPLSFRPGERSAAALIRGRRSGQRYDGVTPISRPAFLRILDRLLPRIDIPPWGVAPHAPCIHPVFLVHRVENLAPGAYLLPRSAEALPQLRNALPTADWQPVADVPAHLPLVLLREGDFREVAAAFSCGQEIASHGAFTLGMLGDFTAALGDGAWGYRALHWEAGVLGQALYLAAEEEGMQGTGIGCFFDDLFHRWLGLEDPRFQTVYHFTLGRAIPDRRLVSHHPYFQGE